jgi:putative flippase GtrA
VSSVRELYQRFRQLLHEGFKFLVVGAAGTVVTFGAANALHSVGKYFAITVATILATVVTYLGNRYWTFRGSRQGQSTVRETIIFLILNGVGLLIYYGCIWLIQDVAGLTGKLWYNAALVIGTGLGTVFRFWSYRKWVWLAIEAGPTQVTDAIAAEEIQREESRQGANGQAANGQAGNGQADGRTGPPMAAGRHRASAGRR